MGCLIV